MAEADKKRAPMMTEGRFKFSEYERQDFVANLELGITVEDLLQPGFWGHVAKKMNPYDHIEARSEDGAWVAHLIVTAVERTYARVIIDRVVKLTTQEVAKTQDIVRAKHVVRWLDSQNKHGIVREDDGAILNKGFLKKDEAAAWLRNYEENLVP